MHKLTLLATGAAILLAGCAAKTSPTWQSVRAVPHAGPREAAPAYTNRLHVALRDAGVGHKVVTFKFRYRSRILLNREGEETAVLYRDPATPAHPWWLMAERLGTPVWLPAEPLASQLAFYVRRPVSIVKVEEFPAKDAKRARKTKHDGKSVLKPFRQGKKAKPSRGTAV
jgi:hypothetical protein